MATVATQAPVDPLKPTALAPAVTSEESNNFLTGCIQELEKDKGKDKSSLAENVIKVGKWANEIDEAFARVTHGLTNLELKFKSSFPDLTQFREKWKIYNEASPCFDQVFLESIRMISSESDLKEVVKELTAFSEEIESNDKSTRMSEGFNKLRHDIQFFANDFDAFVQRTGEDLGELVKSLQGQITDLKTNLQDLDKQIDDATKVLLGSAIGASSMIGCIGLVVAGTRLALLVKERSDKNAELADKQKTLQEAQKKLKEIGQIKTQFDALKPDIELICNRLVLFAEIWTGVRNLVVQFRGSLAGGMKATGNIRFKLEMKLAAELCTPLVKGLETYATKLTNREIQVLQAK